MDKQLDQYDIETIKSGLCHDGAGGQIHCLACGATFEPDEVYPVGQRFYTAARAARHHAQTAHGSRLEALLGTDSRYITLTDHQKKLMALLGQGRSDAEIAAQTGATPATVRRQRFSFREKAKQAKLYLALFELAEEGRQGEEEAYIALPESLSRFDDRFLITRAENDRYLKNAFESLRPPRLRALPVKEKRKVAVLNLIAGQFEGGRDYTEKEVNAILKEVHPQEYVTLRRYLIEYGFLGRVPDGSRYWVRSTSDGFAEGKTS